MDQAARALLEVSDLDFVLYGGGNLSQEAGNVLSQACDFCQIYEYAEIGQVELLVSLKGNCAHSIRNFMKFGYSQIKKLGDI